MLTITRPVAIIAIAVVVLALGLVLLAMAVPGGVSPKDGKVPFAVKSRR